MIDAWSLRVKRLLQPNSSALPATPEEAVAHSSGLVRLVTKLGSTKSTATALRHVRRVVHGLSASPWQKRMEPAPHPLCASPYISGLSSCPFWGPIWSRPINLLSHHSKHQPASVVCSNAWKQARLKPFAKSHLVPGKSSLWLLSLPPVLEMDIGVLWPHGLW